MSQRVFQELGKNGAGEDNKTRCNPLSSRDRRVSGGCGTTSRFGSEPFLVAAVMDKLIDESSWMFVMFAYYFVMFSQQL